MVSTSEILDKLEARKRDIIEKLEREEKVLDSISIALYERIYRLQVEEAILIGYLNNSKKDQLLDTCGKVAFGDQGVAGFNTNEDYLQSIWNKSQQDSLDSCYEDYDYASDSLSPDKDNSRSTPALEDLLDEYTHKFDE
ncbi:hypothetical protein DSO57_1031258 [Entomophthora muscae]|uniref:Uncharacterized protein n=1 Tax=Entomophthora muscae TaxID=34485 RepID=A0ACC2TBX3_9FUNG|nr:hypothetical protein DSO57_1031258 [Entomophthora muscae]